LAAAPYAPARQTQRHVVDHAAPGQEARILEHDAGVFAQAGHVLPVQPDAALGGGFQPGHQSQQGGLAAAAAAHDGDEFAGLDHEFGVLQYLAFAIAFGQAPYIKAHAAAGFNPFRSG
jgi:hypothetical protein